MATVEPRWQDARARPLRDLRISLTDRCNFRCSYCMPKAQFGPEHVYLPSSDRLTFAEIVRLARVLVAHGVDKIRLTGGEPLLRKGIEDLIADLAALRTPNGQAVDLALTTNGSLLCSKARVLRQAGLQRITVSLDALDDVVFRRMNDVDFPVQTVLEGIAEAQAVGLAPVKVNMVVKAGTNDDQILPMVRYFRGSGVALRFIEYMDVGQTNGWQAQHVLPNAQVLALIQREFPLRPLNTQRLGETANRWAYADGAGQLAAVNGEVGFISSVSQAFCADCTRLRLSADGRLFLCLFAHQGHDVRTHLRNNISDEALTTVLAQLWQRRNDRYSALRGVAVPLSRMEMNYMGG